MPRPSPLTHDLITAGPRTPAGSDPLSDALRALEAAGLSLRAAMRLPPGEKRTIHLTDFNVHVDGAKHCVSAEVIRSADAA